RVPWPLRSGACPHFLRIRDPDGRSRPSMRTRHRRTIRCVAISNNCSASSRTVRDTCSTSPPDRATRPNEPVTWICAPCPSPPTAPPTCVAHCRSCAACTVSSSTWACPPTRFTTRCSARTCGSSNTLPGDREPRCASHPSVATTRPTRSGGESMDMPMEQPCGGNVALVTGASKGVGRGVAVALGAAGWTVYLTGRGPAGQHDRLGTAARTVTANGGTGHAAVCDHQDDEQTQLVLDRIIAEQGRLDLLVNNAWSHPTGFAGFSEPFWQRPVDDWDTLIGLGLRAHYVAATLAARVMVRQGNGLITNISSFGGRGYLHSVLYGMPKAGLDKMSGYMSVDLKDKGATALSLWLGLQQTDRLLSAGIEEFAG